MKTWRPIDNPDNSDPSLDLTFLEICQSLDSRVTQEKKTKTETYQFDGFKLKVKYCSPISSPQIQVRH